METRYILPATIATALHALVLFGIKEPRMTVAPPPPPERPLPPVTVEFDDPVEPVETGLSDSAPAKASPAQPELPDPPSSPLPGQVVIKTARPNIAANVHPSRIPPGLSGPGDGDGFGEQPLIDPKQLDNPPHARVQVPPVYPSAMRDSGISGEVLVAFIVDEQGRVTNPRVVQSVDAGFDEATLRAIGRWRFEPGKRNGRLVRFRMVVPVDFDLGR